MTSWNLFLQRIIKYCADCIRHGTFDKMIRLSIHKQNRFWSRLSDNRWISLCHLLLFTEDLAVKQLLEMQNKHSFNLTRPFPDSATAHAPIPASGATQQCPLSGYWGEFLVVTIPSGERFKMVIVSIRIRTLQMKFGHMPSCIYVCVYFI